MHTHTQHTNSSSSNSTYRQYRKHTKLITHTHTKQDEAILLCVEAFKSKAKNECRRRTSKNQITFIWHAKGSKTQINKYIAQMRQT